MKVYEQVKKIYDELCPDARLTWEGTTDFKSLDQSQPYIAELTEIEKILESNGQVNPYFVTIYRHLTEAPEDLESFDEFGEEDETETGGSDEGMENGDAVLNDEPPVEDASEDADNPDELGKNEDSFEHKYPDVDAKETLKKSYVTWLDSMTNKPFFKTMAAFYDLAKMNQLNFVDRAFLWKFLKAVSSCITHLLIEGEQREESICLVDTYFDSLNDCLLSTIHAKDKDDVIQSFLYMVSFLGLNRDQDGNEENVVPEGSTSNVDAGGSVGEF